MIYEILMIYCKYITEVYIMIKRPAKTLPPRGAGWEPGRLAFQS